MHPRATAALVLIGNEKAKCVPTWHTTRLSAARYFSIDIVRDPSLPAAKVKSLANRDSRVRPFPSVLAVYFAVVEIRGTETVTELAGPSADGAPDRNEFSLRRKII